MNDTPATTPSQPPMSAKEVTHKIASEWNEAMDALVESLREGFTRLSVPEQAGVAGAMLKAEALKRPPPSPTKQEDT